MKNGHHNHDSNPSAGSQADEKRFWRSLEERNGGDEFFVALQREFPEYANRLADGATRRQFLQLMGASLALAGVQGCVEQPQENIIAQVRAPEYIVPGLPLYYATAMTHDGGATGLLVETHMGRPIKSEGNPRHPAVPEVVPRGPGPDDIRFGATDAFSQAIVLSLYDPDRSQTVIRAGQVTTWGDFVEQLSLWLVPIREAGGRGLRILTGNIVSPTLADQITAQLEEFPEARWHQYEAISHDNALQGSRLAFGADLAASYRIDRADVILSLDADFLAEGPEHLRYSREFSNRRRFTRDIADEPANMNRLYVVETTRSLTGAAADNRLGVSPRAVVQFAQACARELGLSGIEANAAADEAAVPPERLAAVVEDLQSASGRGLVIAGRAQPPIVHALTHWINETLGNAGQTVTYSPPIAVPEGRAESLRSLVQAMQNEEVSGLLILEGNPVYDALADLQFASALKKVPFSAHLSIYEDETSHACGWHIPALHLFETWSDTRAPNGTATIVQPTIAPLYPGKTVHEMIAALAGRLDASSYDLVRDYWQRRYTEENLDESANFENWWRIVLHDGVASGTASAAQSPTIRGELTSELGAQLNQLQAQLANGELSICFRPDPSVWDGRFANNAWLQELPRPFTTLTWDNAALISPQLARERELETGDVVEIGTTKAKVRVPVLVLPGQPQNNITLPLGYGRTRAGSVGSGVGIDVYPLRTTDTQWFADATTLRKTGETSPLAMTQGHHLMEGRHLVRAGTLAEYSQDPEHPSFMHVAHGESPDISMYPEHKYEGYKWGMVINQSACIGCNACVVACQAENNIPVVGKDQVANSREMHWLRIDHYYEGPEDSPTSYHQPMMCVHCELAPCEPVCPVAATTHSSEGLNEMTYNRCIGTRYCSNNCPYKVRRFNFLDYNQDLERNPVAQLRPNPDVTVRERGVMEKCTYCVQRISAARINAEKDGRRILDGEVVTACQAACPTAAIVFGDLNNVGSAVVRARQSPLNYAVLGELNTRPRTTHVAAVRNPNPRLATPASIPHAE
jgi:molybdopterin-containing oxidoreductase family iron-sulfur binding subunit